MSLKNLDTHLKTIDNKIAALYMQTTGCQSEIKPDIIGNLEGRIKNIEEQNEYIQERFSNMTSQIITNEYEYDEYMDEQMTEMKKEI